MQVKDTGELDKITYFTRGLISPLREEVQYRRCQTISAAMTVALEYDRSHGHHARGYRLFQQHRQQDAPRQNHAPTRPQENQVPQQGLNEPEPMEINSGKHNNRRGPPRKKCTYCKKQGHSFEQCYKRMFKERLRSRNYDHSTVNTFRATEKVSAAVDERQVVELQEISTTEIKLPPRPATELIRFAGYYDGSPVVIMMDSGSTMNVVRPGLTDQVKEAGKTQVTRFDGTAMKNRPVKKGKVDDELQGFL
jgi:hypothetical protein